MANPGSHRHEAGSDRLQAAIAAAKWTGVDPTSEQVELLEAYRVWLAQEAIPSGGLGPNEEQRLWTRHIADSLLFGNELGDRPSCLDIGSGVGLPGIPLAVTHPQTRFDLVDRSGRRCDLLRRAIGVLGLKNCRVIHTDLAHIAERYPFVVSRAAMPAGQLLIHVKHRLASGGIGYISVSRSGGDSDPVVASSGLKVATINVPSEILDTKVQLLRIEAIRNWS